MSTETRELELVGKVEMRIALAKDDKLESVLKPYLPPLLLKLASEHAAVRNKVPNKSPCRTWLEYVADFDALRSYQHASISRFVSPAISKFKDVIYLIFANQFLGELFYQ